MNREKELGVARFGDTIRINKAKRSRFTSNLKWQPFLLSPNLSVQKSAPPFAQ